MLLVSMAMTDCHAEQHVICKSLLLVQFQALFDGCREFCASRLSKTFSDFTHFSETRTVLFSLDFFLKMPHVHILFLLFC